MHQRTQRGWLIGAAAIAVALMLLSSSSLAAHGSEVAGASLSLNSEMRATTWDGPLFDLLVGLAVGASAAALYRFYLGLAAPRRTAG